MTTPEKISKKVKRIAALEAELASIKAQLIHQHHFASHGLNNCGERKGSAVIISIKALNGGYLVEPVAIRNGLSAETIAALHADLVRSYKYAIELKPKGAE